MPMHIELTGKSHQQAKNSSAASIAKFKSDITKVGRKAEATGYKTRTSATDLSSIQKDFKSRSVNAKG